MWRHTKSMSETARNLLVITPKEGKDSTQLYQLYNALSRAEPGQVITALTGQEDNAGLRIWEYDNEDTLLLTNNTIKTTFSSAWGGPSEQVGEAAERWDELHFTHYWLAAYSREAQIWETTQDGWTLTWHTDDYTQGADEEALQDYDHPLGPEAEQKLAEAEAYL